VNYVEKAYTYSVAEDKVLGVIAMPERSNATGVIIVVGGPQYRLGCHRQFLLLSRALARAGYPVMRFDYRGMGDSTGDLRNFEVINEDIGAAIDTFLARCPQVERVVLWGLCDGASSSLLYWDEMRDVRIAGMVLLNPWVRSVTSLAKTQIKHYYGQRLFQANFWHKLLTGKLGIGRALGGLIGSVKNARQKSGGSGQNSVLPFHKKMARGLASFPGQVLILLSGNDYTAKEFTESVRGDPIWECCLKRPNVTQNEIPEADHTFSSAEWRGQVEKITLQWLDKRAGQ
jgi:exosortase A-associated hydrolase 1